jgi:hypothetical protein
MWGWLQTRLRGRPPPAPRVTRAAPERELQDIQRRKAEVDVRIARLRRDVEILRAETSIYDKGAGPD